MTRPRILAFGLAVAFSVAARSSAFTEIPADPSKPKSAQSARNHGAGGSHPETPQELAGDVGRVVVAESHGREARDSQGHEEPNILEFKPKLMVATVIVFGTLLLVLWRFAWGPLSKALADRERQQEDTVRLAEEAREESARLLAEHRRQMELAAEQVRQMLEDARRQADANAASIVQQAEAAATANRQRAEREIGTARDQALMEIWNQTADLAVSVAGKVLGREMSHDDHRRLVEAATAELPAAPVGVNGNGSHSA